MKNITQKIISTILMLALVAGCFAAMPLNANAAELRQNSGPFSKGDTLYTIGYDLSGYNLDYKQYNDVTGKPMLNNNGEIFPIWIEDSTTNIVWYSFCFHGGSVAFAGTPQMGCDGYLYAPDFPEEFQYDDLTLTRLLAAYNYIDDLYGDLNENRALTQIITWCLLECIDVNSEYFTNLDWATVERGSSKVKGITAVEGIGDAKDIVLNVLRNYASADIENPRIVEVVVLVCNEGHDLANCQPQIVPVYQDPTKGFDGKLTIEKTVDGELFAEWSTNYPDVDELLLDIDFTLYKLDNDENREFRANGQLDKNGFIQFKYFGTLESGWYEIEEKLVETAANVFEQMPPLRIYINDDGKAFIDNTDFDYDAFYTIKSGYGSGYTLGYTGLNNNGDIFPIGVANAETGQTYVSFCANAGSKTFDETDGGYMVTSERTPLKTDSTPADKADFVAAYNYIESAYGPLNEYRVVTQIVTWYLLGAIEVPSDNFDHINWAKVEAGTDAVKGVPDAKAIVEDVIAKYDKCEPCNTNIFDVVFMVSANDPDDFLNNQPQLVPIYGDLGKFDNTEKQQYFGALTISADMGKYFSVSGSITGGYSTEGTINRDKQPHNLEVELGGKGNWFQFNKMDFTTQTSYTFDLVQGDKLTKVGEYTITLVCPKTKEFTVTFASKDGKDALNAVGARLSISNNIAPFKNKNDKGFNANYIWTTSPGQQQFSLDSSYTFNANWVTDLKDVKVYIHLDGINGYIDTNNTQKELAFLVTGPNDYKAEVILTREQPSKTIALPVGDYTIQLTGSPVAPIASVSVEKDSTTQYKYN